MGEENSGKALLCSALKRVRHMITLVVAPASWLVTYDSKWEGPIGCIQYNSIKLFKIGNVWNNGFRDKTFVVSLVLRPEDIGANDIAKRVFHKQYLENRWFKLSQISTEPLYSIDLHYIRSLFRHNIGPLRDLGTSLGYDVDPSYQQLTELCIVGKVIRTQCWARIIVSITSIIRPKLSGRIRTK